MKIPEYNNIFKEALEDDELRNKILSSKVTKELLAKNDDAIDEFQKNLVSRVKKVHAPLKLFQLFRLFLHDQLRLYKTVVSSSEKDTVDIDQLMFDLAEFRCNDDTEDAFANKIQPNLNKIQQALHSANIPKNQIASEEVWEAWRKVLHHSHLTDVTSGAFSKTYSSVLNENLRYRIDDFCKSYNLIAEMFFDNFCWVTQSILMKMESVKEKINGLEGNYKIPFKLDPEDIAMNLTTLSDKIGRFMQNIHLNKNFDTSYQSCEELHKKIYELHKQLGDYRNLIRQYKKKAAEESYSDRQKNWYLQFVDICEEMQKAHVLFDTFIADPVSSMYLMIITLNQNPSAVRNILKKNNVTGISENSNSFQENWQNADVIAKQLIEEEAESKIKKGKGKKAKSSKKSKNKKNEKQLTSSKTSCEKKTPSNVISKTNTAISSDTLRRELILERKLRQKIQTTSSTSERLTLKNAYYHLNNLIAAEELVNLTNFEPKHRLNLITSVQGFGYYLLEQVLRSELINNDSNIPRFHGLGRHLKLLPTVLKTRAIADRLYLAYNWTRDFHDFWSHMTLTTVTGDSKPKALEEIVHIALNPNSKDSVGIREVLNKDYVDVLSFCSEIESDVKESLPLRKKEIFVTNDLKIKIKTLNSLYNTYDMIVKKIPFAEDHPLRCKLHQSLDKLGILSSTIELLNKTEKPNHFSMLVGRFAHILTQVLEEQLKTICILNCGFEPRTHFLDALWEIGKLNIPIPNLFLSHFQHLSRTSRYPFEEDEPKNQLHRLLLAAIVLQDNPEIEEGFSLVGKNKILTSEEIRKELKETLEQALDISKNVLLPIIQTKLSI